MSRLIFEGAEGKRVFKASELPRKLLEDAGSYRLEPNGTITQCGIFRSAQHSIEEFKDGRHVIGAFITSHKIGENWYVRIVTNTVFARNRKDFLAHYRHDRWVQLKHVDEQDENIEPETTRGNGEIPYPDWFRRPLCEGFRLGRAVLRADRQIQNPNGSVFDAALLDGIEVGDTAFTAKFFGDRLLLSIQSGNESAHLEHHINCWYLLTPELTAAETKVTEISVPVTDLPIPV